jgi:hypothetical protein
MKKYTPELGQAFFGQKWHGWECPDYICAFLDYLDSELSRIRWNIDQKEYSSPFGNNGNKFKNHTFEVQAYSWDEDSNQGYNFKWNDIKISWYKHAGRGMTINKKMTPARAVEMFNDCLRSLLRMEQRDMKKRGAA